MLRSRLLIVLNVAGFALGSSPEIRSEDEIKGYHAELAAMSNRLASISQEITQLRRDFARLNLLNDSSTHSVTKQQAVAGSRKLQGDASSRKLQGTSGTYVAMDTVHLHEFPDGHTCNNVEGGVHLMPEKTDGALTWEPSPMNVKATFTLAPHSSDLSGKTIQSVPAPFIIKHDQGCSAPPTMEIRMDVDLASGASVGGSLVEVPRATPYNLVKTFGYQLLHTDAFCRYNINLILTVSTDTLSEMELAAECAKLAAADNRCNPKIIFWVKLDVKRCGCDSITSVVNDCKDTEKYAGSNCYAMYGEPKSLGALSSNGVVFFQTCGGSGDSMTFQFKPRSSTTWMDFASPATHGNGKWRSSQWTAGSTEYSVRFVLNGFKSTESNETAALATGDVGVC